MADDTLPLFSWNGQSKRQQPALSVCLQCRHVFVMDRPGRKFCSPVCLHAYRRASMERRFWQYVQKTETCWLWQVNIDKRGYGHLYGYYHGEQKMMQAHRYAYLLLVGPIPEGMTLDHLCRVRHCVNPAHLEVVTRWENVRRGDTITGNNTRKTHCKYGHALTPENLDPDKHGWRRCAECRRRNKRISEKQRRLRGVIPKRSRH